MRFLKLGVYYPKYLEEFYSRHPELTNLPYSAQHQALIDDCFGSSDFASRVLQNLGYQTCDLIANAELLQKAWADENDFKFDDANWLFEITAAQIKKFRPEVLLVADYSTITANFLRTIRRECPSTRLVLGWCGAPYTDATVFSEWDIVLSCVPEMVAAFRAQGHKSYHVNHAFAPRILEKIDLDKQPDINFSFIGSVLKANQFHLERESFVLELVRRTDLQIWSDIKNPTSEESRNIFVRRQAYQAVKAVRQAGVPEKFLTALPLVGKIARWNNPPNLNYCVDKAIRRRNHQPLFGLEMFQKLRDSRMVFNNHINISPFSASNMRLFELPESVHV